MRIWAATCRAMTTSSEAITAARKAEGGSGVPRTRLSTPDSRRMTVLMASPANAAATTPYPISPATR